MHIALVFRPKNYGRVMVLLSDVWVSYWTVEVSGVTVRVVRLVHLEESNLDHSMMALLGGMSQEKEWDDLCARVDTMLYNNPNGRPYPL